VGKEEQKPHPMGKEEQKPHPGFNRKVQNVINPVLTEKMQKIIHKARRAVYTHVHDF